MTTQAAEAVVFLLAPLVVAALVWQTVALLVLRRDLRRERLQREESDAWAERHAAEVDALRAENAQLRQRVAGTEALLAVRTRQAMAQNFAFVQANVRRRQN